MASLQIDPSGNYHITFRFGGRRFKRSLRTKQERQANARRVRLEENITLVDSGRLLLPQNVDVPTFLLSDGNLNVKISIPKSVKLAILFQEFFNSLPDNSLEETTLNTMHIHKRHLNRLLGENRNVQLVSVSDLQTYVNQRSKERGNHGNRVGANTIEKELTTFATVWRWAVGCKKIAGEFPGKGIRLPKSDEKPPFQTWDEIEYQIEQNGLDANEAAELWECLYLRRNEIDALLKDVQCRARHPFIYPMFLLTAHTDERVKTLLTDKPTKEAIDQVQKYCSDSGCEYAAVTNGNQWIFFKTFEAGKRWQDLQAFVIERFDYFVEQYVEASNRFSYTAIDERASLKDLFGDPTLDKRQVFFPKVKIDSYDQEVFRNHLARTVRPIIERYFGKMDAHDDDFMSACYISRREYKESEENVKQVIHDTLSPFFRDYNVSDLFEEEAGGEFFERIPSGSRDKKSRDVIVLFGGKGSGKSTLASRLLYHRPPNSIKHFSKTPISTHLTYKSTASHLHK